MGDVEVLAEVLGLDDRVRQELESHLFNLADILFVALNRKGKAIFINPKGSEILGFQSKEILGASWIENFIPESHREEVRKKYSSFIVGKEGTVPSHASPLQCKNGKLIMVAWNHSIVENSKGEPVAMLCAGVDISKEYRVETLNRELETELQSQKYALDVSAIVAITDSRGRITYANSKFCEISKYKLEELLGQNHRIINSGYHSKKFFKKMWDTISGGRVWKGEIKNKAKDGTYYWVYTTIVPFLDKVGKPSQFAAIRFDITDKKRAEEQLEVERASSVHAEKMASLGEMTAGIAHELGNPLATIRGRMELLKMKIEKGNVDFDSINTVIDTIIRLSDRMTKIIQSMRNYSRDASKDPFEMKSLNDVVEESYEITNHKLDKAGIEFLREYSKEELNVNCRETEILQVLVNLIVNAKDALEGLDSKWIKIQTYSVDDKVQIRITDSGPGIDASKLEMIFKPFYSSKSLGKGTGLGLSISRQIIESHEGSLFVDENSKNTSFVIELPKFQGRQ